MLSILIWLVAYILFFEPLNYLALRL